MLDEDRSGPARKRLPTLNIDRFNVPDTTPRREDRAPDTDWTGHQYKSPTECIKTGIDYDHVGRTSTAAKRVAS